MTKKSETTQKTQQQRHEVATEAPASSALLPEGERPARREAGVYGALLRKLRADKQVTMGVLAKHLRVSVSYLSDVERGEKPPLVPERTLEVATYLGLDWAHSTMLIHAGARERGAYELKPGLTAVHDMTGASLVMNWEKLTVVQLMAIRDVINGGATC